jgi:hypothetical protein
MPHASLEKTMKDTDVRCSECGKSVEVCFLCEEPECRNVICRECLDIALGQAKARTFTLAETP